MTTTLTAAEAVYDAEQAEALEEWAADLDAIGQHEWAAAARARNTPEARAEARANAVRVTDTRRHDNGGEPDWERIADERAENARGSWWRDGGAA